MPFLFQYADTTALKKPALVTVPGDKPISVKIFDDGVLRRLTSVSKEKDVDSIKQSFNGMETQAKDTKKLDTAYGARIAKLKESILPVLDTANREDIARIRYHVDNLAGASELSSVVAKTGGELNHNELNRLFEKCEAYLPAFK